MVELNRDALLNANKGLFICFIISITIANCILICKKIRKGQFLYTPRSLIMISLAIGDIFLALFPLVLGARLLFELTSYKSIMDCSTYKAYLSYMNFLIHFVFGLGLAVLAADFVQRNRKPQPAGNTSNNIIKSVVYSACPWIIGLIIILPLTMADAYTDVYRDGTCGMSVTKSRKHAMYAVSVILPATLAVLVCIAVMFINFSPPSPVTASYQCPIQGVLINSHNTNVINAAGPPQYPGSNQSYPITSTQGTQQYPSNGIPSTAQVPKELANDKPDPNNWGQVFSKPSAHYPEQQYPVQQNAVQQYPVLQYPAQQYPTPLYAVQYPPTQYPVQQYTTQTNIPYAAPTNVVYQQNTTAFPDPVKEKKALLIVAIIYFICVVPLAAFRMSVTVDILPYDSFLIILNCLFWLSVSRSLITPIFFILVD